MLSSGPLACCAFWPAYGSYLTTLYTSLACRIGAISTPESCAARRYDLQADGILVAMGVGHQPLSVGPVLTASTRTGQASPADDPTNAPWGPPETTLRESNDKILDSPS